MRRGLRWTVVLALASAGIAAAPGVAAAAPVGATPRPTPGNARLQGRFQMAGRVTDASGVANVHVGDKVRRIWTFTPLCPSGACRTVTLVRSRGRGSDTVTLKRSGPGAYRASSTFYAPLRCGSRVYSRGWVVPFTITLKVTGAALSGGLVVATRVKATFTNRSRKNQTPCVLTPAHDAAKYSGTLV